MSAEPDVIRRLADVAATTTVDPEAWAKIEARIASLRNEAPAPRRQVPRRMLAAAAVLAIVLGVAAILAHDDGDRVRTIDGPATTEDPDPTTTRHPRTTTTTAVGRDGIAPPSGDDPSAPADGDGSGSPTGTPSGTASPPSPAPSGPTRLAAVATISSTQGYDVELVYAANTLYLRRTDDVGSTPGPPDGHGYLYAETWADVSGAGCLTWGGIESMLPGATQPEVIVFGVVTSAATQFRIVMADGSASAFGGPVGPVVEPGLRVWSANLPPGPIDHIEARDAANDLVGAIANPSPGITTSVQC